MNIPPVISLKNIVFGYRSGNVLDGLNMDVLKGDFVGLVGHNGTGKSTLLKIILGVLTPQNGTVKLFGTPIKKFKDWDKIGYIPQKAGLSVSHVPITVDEVMRMEKASDYEVDEALSSVDMLSYKHQLLRELSGGQQQRVFIARALVKNPELLILDEPTVGVDVKTQEKFYELMQKLNHDFHLTLLLVSHDLHTISHQVHCVMQLDKKTIPYETNTCNIIHTHHKNADHN
ncbi:MAG: metal ABC transporter ATP-binding protein [Candidatus Roizmanbacteria bacterium]|nr:metal ABC transporter ATP-binding protein [Candidatus Roizmanbacteria bacterium]